jgi:very-short-patch-repair endonuclease
MTSEISLTSRRLRKSMSGTELRVWIRIRRRQLDGWKFRRQHPIGSYVVDFCCPAARLVVEVDGLHHDSDRQWAYDVRRQAWLEAEGYRVLRFRVETVDEDVTVVTDTILAALDEREAEGYMRRPLRPAAPATSPPAGRTA